MRGTANLVWLVESGSRPHRAGATLPAILKRGGRLISLTLAGQPFRQKEFQLKVQRRLNGYFLGIRIDTTGKSFAS